MNRQLRYDDWLLYRESDWCKKRTAYHEAGHIIVGLLVGLTATGVIIYPEDGHREGYTLPQPENDGRVWQISSIQHAAVKWAGPIAEAYYLHGDMRLLTAEILDGARNDSEGARVFLIGMNSPAFALEKVKYIARRLLTKHWRAVEAVAESLWTHGELSGDQITRLAQEKGAIIRDLPESRSRRFLTHVGTKAS